MKNRKKLKWNESVGNVKNVFKHILKYKFHSQLIIKQI